jgi:hypothetical protein
MTNTKMTGMISKKRSRLRYGEFCLDFDGEKDMAVLLSKSGVSLMFFTMNLYKIRPKGVG